MELAGINTGPETHLDHLGVLCCILKIPLFVTEQKTYQLAKKYYPSCETILIEPAELTLEFLAEHFDVLFDCGKFWAMELLPLIEMLYGKKMRIVFCPHGNSDKGFSLNSPHQHVKQDISLVYGDHMIDLLHKTGALLKIGSTIRTGNYRLPFYELHRTFYDTCTDEDVFFRFEEGRRTILYAPTWDDLENPTSFFEACEKVVDQLSGHYNIIVKLHPLLEENHPAQTYRISMQYENHKNVLFLRDFPPIYPLLSKVDIYLGDFSSIGYDFLAFDRPMYFLKPQGAEDRFLHRCGVEIPHGAMQDLNHFLRQTLEKNNELSSMRGNIYSYAFGEKVCLDDLRNYMLDGIKSKPQP